MCISGGLGISYNFGESTTIKCPIHAISLEKGALNLKKHFNAVEPQIQATFAVAYRAGVIFVMKNGVVYKNVMIRHKTVLK